MDPHFLKLLMIIFSHKMCDRRVNLWWFNERSLWQHMQIFILRAQAGQYLKLIKLGTSFHQISVSLESLDGVDHQSFVKKVLLSWGQYILVELDFVPGPVCFVYGCF